MNIEVNFISILLAGVASMAVGFLWYSPLMFAKPWMKAMGHTKESIEKAQHEMGLLYFMSFIVSLVTAYILVHVMSLSEFFYGYTPLVTGLSSAFFMWLGFIMPVQMTDVIFGSRKWKLFYINTGYQLVSILVMGVVLSLF